MIYYSADYHFANHNIIEYCNRPFKNIHKMEVALIRNINEIVGKDDELRIVGDLTLKGPEFKSHLKSIRDRINCKKIILILGNHDELSPRDYVNYIGFDSVHTKLETEEYIIHHDPSKAYQNKEKIWIVGHVHDHWKIRLNCINVGVDVWEFKPVSEKVINQCILESMIKK